MWSVLVPCLMSQIVSGIFQNWKTMWLQFCLGNCFILSHVFIFAKNACKYCEYSFTHSLLKMAILKV